MKIPPFAVVFGCLAASRRKFLVIAMMLLPSLPSHGWQASPEAIAAETKRYPWKVNYDETRVPSYELPDPLRAPSGGVITSAAGWQVQRERLLEVFRTEVYGRTPGKPEKLRFEELENDPHAMNGRATLKRIAIISSVGEREHRFELILFVPNARRQPAPVFLLLNHRALDSTDPTRKHRSPFWPAEEIVERGYAAAAIRLDELAPDNPQTFREGVIRLFGEEGGSRPDDACGALGAWSWGASRAMDYFETAPGVDSSRAAVIGHSRGGKTALWVGAQDTRFALVVANQSGCGGAALSRRRFGETMSLMNSGFPHWFCKNFRRYNNNENALPVDQHMLLALVAPRAIYVGAGDEDLWTDPYGMFLSMAHAAPVFELFGNPPLAPGEMPEVNKPLYRGMLAYHIRTGGHSLGVHDWWRFMDFADRVLARP